MDRLTGRRRCQSVPEADLQKAFSALLMSPEPGALCAKLKDHICELEKSELCSVHGAVKELLCPQKGTAAVVALLPWAREAACIKWGDATCAVNEDVENGSCTANGSVTEPLDPQGRSATWDKHRNILKGYLSPVQWIRSRCKITLGVLILLLLQVLVLVVSLVVSLAVVSEGAHRETPVTPDTPLLLACPFGWVGYRGICYFLSRDQLSWDQAQARCSELGASLAVLQDWEMEFLFLLSWNMDYWLGLRRRGRELQWGDGSSFSSSVPVRGTAECVYLSENYLGSGICSNPLPFVCSRPQTRQRWDG